MLFDWRKKLPIWGVVLSMIAFVYLTQDHFVARTGNETRTITRAGDSIIYWTGEGVITLLAVACLAGGLYLRRR
jgi:hypothetical protein